MLLLALVVHVRAPTGGLGLAALADEVVVRARDDADLLHVADVVEHEGEVVPEGGAEAQADALDAVAAEQLVPGRIELVGVEEAPGRRAELLLGLEDAVGAVLHLGGVLVGRAVVGVDVEARNDKLQVVLVADADHVAEHLRLGPVVGVHEHDVGATGAVEGVVASRGGAGVVLVDDGDADVAVGDGVEDLPGAIGGAVVYGEELPVLEPLVLQALYGASHVPVDVVGGHDDRNLGQCWTHYSKSPDYGRAPYLIKSKMPPRRAGA